MSESQAGNSTSTPQASTSSNLPPRGRSSSRYPSTLAKGEPGRIPLHRRGTSKTYERLEDLLREAGYKETRIFTPETEHAEAEEERKNARVSSVKEGVDAVVGFIAGLMPGSSKNETPSERSHQKAQDRPESTMHHHSHSPSPQVQARNIDGARRLHDSVSPSLSASTTTIASMHSYTSSSSYGGHALVQKPPPQPQRVLRPQASTQSNLRTYAQVSAAQGYLRHMASAPNIPRRLGSSRGQSSEHMSVYLNDTSTPALPTSWLDSVTKAVLKSPHLGAHVGGPLPSRPASRQSGRAARSGKSRFLLSDQTNRPSAAGRSVTGVPAGLTSYLRVETAPGAVSTARVTCRSAPASRSSSRVGERQRFGSVRGKAGQRRTSRAGKPDGVPILASTLVENDAWSMEWIEGERVATTSQGRSYHQALAAEVSEDESDDEGEIDLARLLVPPKRQYSIQSLRKHLHHNQRREDARPQPRPWDDDGLPAVTKGRNRRGSIEGDAHAYGWETMGVPGFDRTRSKRRREIPGGWGTLTGGRS
ncbi:hypothetical protein CERSUDRAFT_127065 [Gelatoporia subvermispora B]|uniref:Uncharacterized protein n=1 Tax=Ceriporiopsis subvermispora (strain B) TaxID=914234 RepID=M2Q512_CERS8|nr:hypothetical protein CERSUDRAFT_127065 [Gelatoporia subvermispora B]